MSENLPQFLNKLSVRGLLSNKKKCEDLAINYKKDISNSWPIVILITVATVSIMGLIITFLQGFDIIKSLDSRQNVIVGIIFMLVAILIHRLVKGQEYKSTVLQILSYCFMLIGKFLFVLATAGGADIWGWNFTLGAFIATATTYYIYPVFIDRLFSFTVLHICFYNACIKSFAANHVLGIDSAYWFNIFYNVVIIIMLVLYVVYPRFKYKYLPMIYSTLFVLIASRMSVLVNKIAFYEHTIQLINAIGIVCLIAWLVGGFNNLKKEPIMLACFSAVIMSFLPVPGLIFAIAFLVIGYAKHDKFFGAAGIVLLIASIAYYYYNLDYTLLKKSIFLVGAGLVLLAGWGYLHFHKLDREVGSNEK